MSNNQLEEVEDGSQLLCLVIHSSLDGYLVHDLVVDNYKIYLTLIKSDNMKFGSHVINFIIIDDHVKVLHFHNLAKFHAPSPFLNKRDIIFHRDLAMTLRDFKSFRFFLKTTTRLFLVLGIIKRLRRVSKHEIQWCYITSPFGSNALTLPDTWARQRQ